MYKKEKQSKMTLEQQYKSYLRRNPDSTFTYAEWLEWFGTEISKALEKIMKRNEGELPDTMNNTLYQFVSNLGERIDGIKYYGDISDLGNEIGYSVGNVVKNMTERETTDFIHGIRHGISLTNGTH